MRQLATDASGDPALLLKITPPKLRRSLLVRERLRRIGSRADDAAVLIVEAPAGYGKTSLIAQWRLDWLQDGAAVAWLNLDAGDSPVTLVSGIALGLRRSTGRADFGTEAIEAVRRGAGTAAALTALLAEITEASCPMVVVFDNGERLAAAEAVEVLDYLLHNLPPNLRIVVGTRRPVHAETLDLLGQGLLRRVTAADLSFDLPETIRLLSTRLSNRTNADLCARLHDVTGGWPLGLQLAGAALERAGDPERAIEEFARSRDDATEHLFEGLVASLPNGLGEFLTRCSLLDSLHPSLCEAVTGDEDAALALQRLVVETPLLSATETGEWLRLHPLAREYLRSRAKQALPEAERREMHIRAWRWFAQKSLPERAAQHALAAGFPDEALELVSAVLLDEFDRGHQGSVIEWLARIPQGAVESNQQLRLVALSMHALGCRLGEVLRSAAGLIDDPAVGDAVRVEAMAMVAAAYALVDRHDEARRHVSSCEAASPGPRARQVLAYIHAAIAGASGETERTRRILVRSSDERITPMVQSWYDFLTVWSYLWEGRPVMAEQAGHAPYSRWTASIGRRGPGSVLLAGVLAGARWQQDLREDARALLADRLDLVEGTAAYGSLVQAFLTMARMAALEGDEARAFAYLEALAAAGESRGMVRVVVVSLAERVRLHAGRRRPAQAAAVAAQLSQVMDLATVTPLLESQVRLEQEMAQTLAAVAADDPGPARAHLARARELATRLNRGYEAIQVLALEALLAERAGASAQALLIEALSRAESGGLVRVFADTLPEIVQLVRRHAQGVPAGTVSPEFIERVLAAAEPRATRGEGAEPPTRSALLTPKEYQVLQLLAGGLPNKRIATELELSADTVKWHVKKLLAKLNAGSRDHAVDRARMLGLLR
jgi:LuxR family maltose regulon positive regulatory protein